MERNQNYLSVVPGNDLHGRVTAVRVTWYEARGNTTTRRGGKGAGRRAENTRRNAQ